MRTRTIEITEECPFEPDSTEILCIDCGKPTGEIGTCEDRGFCPECRAGYVASEYVGEVEFGEMLITLIEGEHYVSRYRPRRVLHLSIDSKPVCGARGGPHPLTENKNESNCKRCVRAIEKPEDSRRGR